MRFLVEFLIAGYTSVIGLILLYYIIRKLAKYIDISDQRKYTAPIPVSNPDQVESSPLATLPVANADNCNSRFKNLVLYSGYNTTFTEIDEVIVSPYGIFCIEYKAHVGYIFGSKTDISWTQCKYNGHHKLYNPLHQNYKHLKALEKLLGSNIKTSIHSLIVFTGAKGVKTDSNQVLTSYDQLHNLLSHHINQCYSAYEYATICNKLLTLSTYSNYYLETHIQELQEYIHAKTAVA